LAGIFFIAAFSAGIFFIAACLACTFIAAFLVNAFLAAGVPFTAIGQQKVELSG
jgi:hypothetical protein